MKKGVLVPVKTGPKKDQKQVTISFHAPMEVISVQGESVEESSKRKVKKVERELPTNPELHDLVSNKVAETLVVNKFVQKVLESGIDIQGEIDQFLLTHGQWSIHTKKSYETSIKMFMDYCQKYGLNPVSITVQNVDKFQIELTSKYCNKTVRNRMLGLSSFYSDLYIRYPKVFLVNPFLKRKLPKDTLKNKHDFVTSNDILELKKELTRIKRHDLITIVDLLVTYGFRVGIFQNMNLDKNGKWSSDSKGKTYNGKFTKKEVKDILKYKVLELSLSTISVTIKKYTKRLHEKHIVSCPFSAHDLRRYYIEKNVDSFGVRPFLDFSKSLHKNVSTTLGYIDY
jgi:hypothetical protein